MKDLNFSLGETLKFTTNNAVFNCRVLGNGRKYIFAFHGFGQDGDAFLPLASSNEDFTIFAFDLPFHGNTWIHNPLLTLTPEEIQSMVEQLVKRLSIKKFSLVGFSIGVKLLFPVILKFQASIQDVWLVAPDGIKINLWYRLVTGTRAMRFLFRYVLNNPKVFHRAVKLIQLPGHIDQSTLQFVLRSINTEHKRIQLYRTWTYLRHLKINQCNLVRILNKEKIPVYFIIGMSDNIISRSAVNSLHRNLTHTEIIELSCGHQNLLSQFAKWRAKQSV